MRNTLAFLFILLSSHCTTSFALDIIGRHISDVIISAPAKPPKLTSFSMLMPQATTELQTKKISLMELHFTPNEYQTLFTEQRRAINPDNTNKPPTPAPNRLPSSFLKGMNRVPVLDQGQHGTCTMFAVTTAMNALMGRGNYISQLCSLALGSYLEDRSYRPSGWDGSWGSFVIEHLLQYGIINKQIERTQGCGGLTQYPLSMATTGTPLSLDDYKRYSEDISRHISWLPLLFVTERFDWDPEKVTENAEALLSQIKKSLANNSRIVVGIALIPRACNVGACATYHQPFDTWAVTNEINKRLDQATTQPAGHEMTISGYDDLAIVTDTQGKQHKGVFILRNSWGHNVGDHGDYYMTYEYFMKFVIEAHALSFG